MDSSPAGASAASSDAAPAPTSVPAPASPSGRAASRAPARGVAETARPRFLRRRRAETLSGLLPLVGFFALMPPFVRIFAHDGRVFGAPAILVFLLTLWLGLVLAVRALSRRLLNPDRDL
ncbi:MAG: hypothetical protein VYD87_01000 [Pseudomonadota bacterium]|nr:hypothetical protein [Pseudomonadota bacterium]MEE3100690.1 hypothetical protein [Pseudomonadota bacterium]